MSIEVTTITGPAYWASYLINGDSSGMEDSEIAACDAWVEAQAPWYIVSTTEEEPRFTWSYDLHGGTARGGDVLDYIAHKPT